MANWINKLGASLLTLSIVAICWLVMDIGRKASPPETKLPPVVVSAPASVIAPRLSIDYVTKVMTVCNAKGSEPVLRSKAALFANIIPTYIREVADQEMYILLLCIESKFDNKARSSVGATGYAQIMPKYAQSFADLCSLGQLGKDDEQDPIINISLGACLFQHLLDTHKSNTLALAAYNAGSASSSVAALKKLGNPVAETAAYVAKATYLKEKVDGKDSDKRDLSNGTGREVSDERGTRSQSGAVAIPSEQVTSPTP